MAAGPRAVSGAGRYRQPSGGTAAPTGVGTVGKGAGHSCAPPRLSGGVGRGLDVCLWGCNGAPTAAMVGGWRQGLAALGPAAPVRHLEGAQAFSVRGVLRAARPGPGDAQLAGFDYGCTSSSPTVGEYLIQRLVSLSVMVQRLQAVRLISSRHYPSQ